MLTLQLPTQLHNTVNNGDRIRLEYSVTRREKALVFVFFRLSNQVFVVVVRT
jgi:hypothetical protein